MSNFRKTEISLQLFRTLQLLKEADMTAGQIPQPQQTAPQAIANSNPMQPLPGQGQQQVVGSSSGEPMSSTGEPLSVDTMINKMNVIRGGRSFSEPEIYGQITALYNKLSEQEKTIIDRILSDIDKLIIDKPATQAPGGQIQGTTPAQPPPMGQKQPAPAQAPPMGAAMESGTGTPGAV